MIKDEDLHSSIDYSGGQREAAHRVLVELYSLFAQYHDDIRVIGGWVPDLLYPDQGHVGSVDVDMLINHLTLKDEGYQTMARILLSNGYMEHPDKYFSFIKQVVINGVSFDVDVDILAGMYGGTRRGKHSQHVQGLKAMKTTGGDFAFKFEPRRVTLEAPRPDGAIDTARVNVVALVPYFIMKTAAMGRGKAKDAYDLYFLIKHYPGGAKQLALEFSGSSKTSTVRKMREKLSEKFASVNHTGPVDVANFMDLSDKQEIEMIRRDAFEQVQALLASI
ncbi:MAG: hypothetical protein PHP38_05130 [Sphaerochaetaceae bacterium]|jgi:hypothetical protein|nr:hypothetical protein [Sphaerochaetaceae bacterium]MDD4259209.1 hypothetical protein [Sphaerochaetaceae bacterium]NLO61737.1 hypothetical protein [Spirochaetales bacterium]